LRAGDKIDCMPKEDNDAENLAHRRDNYGFPVLPHDAKVEGEACGGCIIVLKRGDRWNQDSVPGVSCSASGR